MNLRQIEVFEALMLTRSVSGAARLLKLTQPAITKSLRVAEQNAGFLLFRRVRGQLFPSPEAEALRPEVERVRRDVGTLDGVLRALREGAAGNVSVACVGGAGQAFVTPAVVAMARSHPNVRIEASFLPTAAVIERVAQSHADLGLVHEPIDNPYVDGQLIAQAEAICLMPRKHPLARRRTITVRDLESTPIVTFREDTAIGRLVRQSIVQSGQRRSVNVTVNTGLQAYDLVEAGSALAIIDPFLLATGFRPGLVGIPFRPAIPLRLRIIRPRERPRSRAAAQLEREIRAMVERTMAGRAAG